MASFMQILCHWKLQGHNSDTVLQIWDSDSN